MLAIWAPLAFAATVDLEVRPLRSRPPEPPPALTREERHALGLVRVEYATVSGRPAFLVLDPASGERLGTRELLERTGAVAELERYRRLQRRDLALGIGGAALGGAAVGVAVGSLVTIAPLGPEDDAAFPLALGLVQLAGVVAGVGLVPWVFRAERSQPRGFLTATEVDELLGE